MINSSTELKNLHVSPTDAKPVLVAVHLEDEPYCYNCGEDENLRYNEQYANGEYWTCKECGENFFYNRKEHCAKPVLLAGTDLNDKF